MGVWDVELCVSGSEFCLYGLGFGGRVELMEIRGTILLCKGCC